MPFKIILNKKLTDFSFLYMLYEIAFKVRRGRELNNEDCYHLDHKSVLVYYSLV
jgi:hypothetical protein